MFNKIVILTVVLEVVFFSTALSDAFESQQPSSGNAPFFELPCMAVGGICARSVACPEGTKVGVRGLCPVQQDLGMECCRPPKNIKCKTKGGKCLATYDFSCPRALKIEDANDCSSDEVCCVLRK
ncbi:hypothetical protein PYW07_014179 [Mythimna separata]|uniref:Uncharacterized protein n=1 Tax=Mythimna separata TaxID=271217 RepID=A0AAD8DZ87_MYTSE|nr:hypothetical protein PYW07_014179 [Mythimna separata]